ncbi:MAG: PilZ domain-containing protein [Planctomycetes bacterium]|nr:PilZ domain-containing protein [Planctomycetota bacterium]
MQNILDKREYKRLEKQIMVQFRVKQHKGQETSALYWEMVSVKNVSAGGLLFYYNRNLGFDSILDLKIDISHTAPTINCAGRVVRIEETHSHAPLRIAASFTGLGLEEKNLINRTVEEHLNGDDLAA